MTHIYTYLFILCFLLLGLSTQVQLQAQDEVSKSISKRAFKVELLSPLSNNLTLGYEQSLKHQMALEVKFGIIGAGIAVSEKVEEASGILAKVGVKMMTKSDEYFLQENSEHSLAGFYIKPELIFTHYQRKDQVKVFTADGNSYDQYIKEKDTEFALLMNIGRQWIIANRFSIDIHGGIGYARATKEDKETQYGLINSYKYSHISGGKSLPIAISGGFMLGILLY